MHAERVAEEVEAFLSGISQRSFSRSSSVSIKVTSSERIASGPDISVLHKQLVRQLDSNRPGFARQPPGMLISLRTGNPERRMSLLGQIQTRYLPVLARPHGAESRRNRVVYACAVFNSPTAGQSAAGIDA
jgi:hypothetical protein